MLLALCFSRLEAGTFNVHAFPYVTALFCFTLARSGSLCGSGPLPNI